LFVLKDFDLPCAGWDATEKSFGAMARQTEWAGSGIIN